MPKYDENIRDNSVWITATPTSAAATLPFYVTETGHFIAYEGYSVSRDMHDSYLMLYTIHGIGTVVTDDHETELTAGNCIIIDCKKTHSYRITEGDWEFYWIHFKGIAAEPMFDILYPGDVRAAQIDNAAIFERRIKKLMEDIKLSDIISNISVSNHIHQIFNELISLVIDAENAGRRQKYQEEIEIALEYIKENYSDNITIDDIISRIHISKYHFIRLFKRVMGTTPYSYLTNYRITMSKRMLRLTDKSVADIAEKCGFLDTSNFIRHFKKHTGEKPIQYRRDFS